MNKLNFVHITDTHILQEYKGSFLEKMVRPNSNPSDNLIKTLENVKSLPHKPDFILISGDLVHEGKASDYEYFKQIIEDHVIDIPVYTVLGNHDVTAAYWEGFAGKANCTDQLFYETDINGYRLIVLDSSYDHSGVGMVDSEQLNWLANVLKTPAEKGSLVVVHHPLEAGEVNDGHALTNSKELLSIINDSDVIAVLSGHTHQNKISNIGDILLSTADSIAFGGNVSNESFQMNDRTGFSLCTVDENGLAVQTVRFPDDITVFLSFSFKELQQLQPK
ncbi:metallophosphoesterase family protein [Neobacillus massiliamazoniensis]|uniref:Metallophosphoesterase n=1 Tax=Neobacillus massiliamazoniensis TaxID=1499688 RepID=A0A0U1NTX7_9BACI|nr:metallophosphoesterase [Neobacillus massiliamazoniensis]CRK81425.1 metallophosphoesterase [Neobacillus massiliamazoniensis]